MIKKCDESSVIGDIKKPKKEKDGRMAAKEPKPSPASPLVKMASEMVESY